MWLWNKTSKSGIYLLIILIYNVYNSSVRVCVIKLLLKTDFVDPKSIPGLGKNSKNSTEEFKACSVSERTNSKGQLNVCFYQYLGSRIFFTWLP